MIYIYITPNAYDLPIKEPADNYYWVTQFYNYRTNTKEQLDFAIEKISACLEWTKKKNEETKGGMQEWLEKDEEYLRKLEEKREELLR